jgi:hypothetical protein
MGPNAGSLTHIARCDGSERREAEDHDKQDPNQYYKDISCPAYHRRQAEAPIPRQEVCGPFPVQYKGRGHDVSDLLQNKARAQNGIEYCGPGQSARYSDPRVLRYSQMQTEPLTGLRRHENASEYNQNKPIEHNRTNRGFQRGVNALEKAREEKPIVTGKGPCHS